MVSTRSKSQEADTENAVRDKVTERPRKPAKVTNAKSGASQQKVDTKHRKTFGKEDKIWFYKPTGNVKKTVAFPKSSGKYYDLDEWMLAMGIFIDTVKEERLKNDPDFAFTTEFYRTVRHDFDSLNDDNKAMYIAEAKKRNTIEDKALASKRVVKKKSIMDDVENLHIEGKAVNIYLDAVKADRLKNPGGNYGPMQISYFVALKNDEDRDPYLAEATLRQLEEVTEWMKNLDKFGKQ